MKAFLAIAVPERAPRARILAALCAMLPRVGVADDGAFVCDLRGTERLLGAPLRVARNAISVCGASGGQLLAGGLATTPFVARVAASRAPAGKVSEIPAGGERAFLDGLPLDVLPLDPKVVAELALLGVRRIGEFLALPRGAAIDRFGHAAGVAYALATGDLVEDVRGVAPRRRIRAKRMWDDPVDSRERLIFALRSAADELAEALRHDGLAALGLVTSAGLEIIAVEPARGRQIGLFAPDGARAEEAISVAQFLRTRLGAATVLQPRVVDAEARLPERAADWEEVVR